MDARTQARRKIELALKNALPRDEFELFYQPIVNLKTNQITSFEALLRWHHPERGLILPTEFVPVAEEIGLIAPIGDWVIYQSCKEAATWPEHLKVAINLSPAHLARSNIIALITGALAAARLPANRVELEVTEAVLLHATENTLATLHQLRDMGVRIALDDFGTGYSSLSYLRSFPFDKLKIDCSFIKDVGGNEESAAILRRSPAGQGAQRHHHRRRRRDGAAVARDSSSGPHRNAGFSVQSAATARQGTARQLAFFSDLIRPSFGLANRPARASQQSQNFN